MWDQSIDKLIVIFLIVIGVAHQPVQLISLIFKTYLHSHSAVYLIVIHLNVHTIIGVAQVTFQHSQSEINQTIIAAEAELHRMCHPLFMWVTGITCRF